MPEETEQSPEWVEKPQKAKHIFPWSPLRPVCNKGRKHQKMSCVLQQLRVTNIEILLVKLQPQLLHMFSI